MAPLKTLRVWTRISLGLLLLCDSFVLANASTAKFQSWFPLLSESTYQETSSQNCNATLTLYYASLQGNDTGYQAATCSHQQKCLLEQLREDIKSRMGSASVLLGLTPGLLASVGPSVAETAVLATQAPWLSFLISLGCPAVYPSRVLEYEDVREVLRKDTFQPISNIHKHNPGMGLLFKIAKYLSLIIAIANVFYTSWQLGIKTVVSWRCVNYTLPLAWSMLSVVIHLFASAAFHTHWRHFWPSKNATSDYELANTVRTPNSATSDHGNPARYHQKGGDLNDRLKPTNRSIVLQYVASFLGFIHVVFGIMIFSSLLFIETVDVVAVILRYMASVLTSRSILMFELDHIRRRQNSQRRNSEQSRSIGLEPVSAPESPDEINWTIARKPVPRAQTDEVYGVS